MSAPPQHGGGQQCKKRSKSRVHQAPVCSKDSVSESFPARATSRNPPPPKKKLSPTSRRGGYHFLYYLTCHLRQSALAVTSSMHLFKPVFEGHSVEDG